MNGICGRCLIYPNVTSILQAEWLEGGLIRQEICQHITSPAAVLRWIEGAGEKSGGDARFTVDADTGAVTAISTWNGDEVCQMHLWRLVAAEMGVSRQ